MARRTLRLLALGALGLAAAAALTVAACGRSVPDGVRVRVRVSEADGPIPGTLFVEAAAGENEGERTELVPVEGDADGLMVAPGTEDGAYRVVSSGGWGMLWAPPLPPILSRDPARPLVEVSMGRPHTLYVGARSGEPLGETWVAERMRRDPAAGHERTPAGPVPAAVVPQPWGNLVSLRFAPEAWHGDLRLLGRMADGALTGFEAVTVPPDHTGPLLVFTARAATRALAVWLAPSDPGAAAAALDDVTVTAGVPDLPLDASVTHATRDGRVLFRALPDLGHDLRVEVGTGAGAVVVPLPVERWRQTGSLSVLAPSEALRDVELEGAPENVAVQVRPVEGDRYGLLSIRREGDRTIARTVPGGQRWILRSGDTFATLLLDVPADGTVRVRMPALEPGARVRGRLLPPATRLVFARVEDERLVAGHGFEVAPREDGSYRVLLPPGRWQARAVTASGAGDDPIDLTLAPGGELRRDFGR